MAPQHSNPECNLRRFRGLAAPRSVELAGKIELPPK